MGAWEKLVAPVWIRTLPPLSRYPVSRPWARAHSGRVAGPSRLAAWRGPGRQGQVYIGSKNHTFPTCLLFSYWDSDIMYIYIYRFGVLEVWKSSGRPVGKMSTNPGTLTPPWCRVMAQIPSTPCIYIYIYTHIHMYTYVYICGHACAYTYIHAASHLPVFLPPSNWTATGQVPRKKIFHIYLYIYREREISTLVYSATFSGNFWRGILGGVRILVK